MKKIVLALGLLLACYLVPISQASAAGQLICYEVSSLVCQPVGTGTPLPITGSFSATLGGFTPSASGARGTPVTVTTSDSSGTLPTGAVVLVSNPGANLMYCNVNGVAATISDEPITSGGGWFAFTIPSGVTVLHCIATGGSTTANMVGGSGLPTGTGGGGGSGGGGAITIASGAVASGAYSAGSVAAGAGVDGWDLTEGTKEDTPCTAPATTTACTLDAVQKAILNAATSPIPLGTANGWTPVSKFAITTAVTIKSSAGWLGKVYCDNPNASVAYLEVFNTTSPTLGTTAPLAFVPLAASTPGGYVTNAIGEQFSTAIAVAAVTAANGGSTVSTGLNCSFDYN